MIFRTNSTRLNDLVPGSSARDGHIMPNNSWKMNIPSKLWTKKRPPRRILAIRLQAMGDVVIALPYLQHLRNCLPSSTRLDFLTRTETEDIPRNILLFNKVYTIGGGRNFKRQLISTLLLLPRLMMRRYEVVLDLQNNVLSEITRKALFAKSWTVFDRTSPIPAAERYRLTIEAAGIALSAASYRFNLKDPRQGFSILKNSGWKEEEQLVALNPAGAFSSRNWELSNYVDFAKLWLNEFPRTRFVTIGTSLISAKSVFLKEHLGDCLYNLTGLTSPAEAFSLLQRVRLVLSEDSGLMHMAWCSGVPTVALFGSTRSDWAKPLREHNFYLDSSDLPCGNCMLAVCKFGDVHCLSRYSAAEVFSHASSLIKRLNRPPGISDSSGGPR